MPDKLPHIIRMMIGAAMAVAPQRALVADVIVLAMHFGRDDWRGDGGELSLWWPSDYAVAIEWAKTALDYLPERDCPTGAAVAAIFQGELPAHVAKAGPVLSILAATGDEGAQRLIEEVDAIAAISEGQELAEIAEVLR